MCSSDLEIGAHVGERVDEVAEARVRRADEAPQYPERDDDEDAVARRGMESRGLAFRQVRREEQRREHPVSETDHEVPDADRWVHAVLLHHRLSQAARMVATVRMDCKGVAACWH